MKFDALRHRVQRSERLVEGRSHRLQENWQALGTAWRGLWTPWRIVGAGVVAGFLSGRAEPLAFAGKLGSVRWMEILTTVSTFVTEITAANAAASDPQDEARRATGIGRRGAAAPGNRHSRCRAARARHRPKPPPTCPAADPPRRSGAHAAAPARGRRRPERACAMTASPSDPAPSGAPAEPASVPAKPPRAPLSVKLLAVIAVGIVLWAAQAVLLPILVAVFFAGRQSDPRAQARAPVPRAGFGAGDAGRPRPGRAGRHPMLPAAVEWAQEAPHAARQMAPKLRDLLKPVQDAGQAAENFARAAGGQMGRAPDIVHTAQDDPFGRLLATPRGCRGAGVALLTFFFMVFGERLWRNAVACCPRRASLSPRTSCIRSNTKYRVTC
jgi:hypothetical protein